MSEGELRERMKRLRNVMFGRKGTGEAFHPLDETELALLEQCVLGYIASRRLTVGEKSLAAGHYEIVRCNLLTGMQIVKPEDFRLASAGITRDLIHRAIAEFDIPPAAATVLLPWRAGLAFADAAFSAGFREFYHFGARRNERTLATEVYYEEVPHGLTHESGARSVLIADPMLATGNTTLAALHDLERLGVPQERIFVLAVISAPEGIDHILDVYPKVRIFAGRHDERLNSRGYIEPGLGDYGDEFFKELGPGQVVTWHRWGVLSDGAAEALLARMAQD
jgi:uracil phosphoribosyltransferase